MHVNVAPATRPPGRIPVPTVRSELGDRQAQDAKRKTSDALRRGDAESAAELYNQVGDVLGAAMSAAPQSMARRCRRRASCCATSPAGLLSMTLRGWRSLRTRIGRGRGGSGGDECCWRRSETLAVWAGA